MKKLLIKSKVIDIPYSPAIEAVEATETEPAIEAIPEQLEVSHIEIIDQTQGPDADLELWLSGNLHKYAKGTVAEYYDISHEFELAECLAKRASEYPQLGDFLNAWFDDQSKLADLAALRLEIKAKYPKPPMSEPVSTVIVDLFPDPVLSQEEL